MPKPHLPSAPFALCAVLLLGACSAPPARREPDPPAPSSGSGARAPIAPAPSPASADQPAAAAPPAAQIPGSPPSWWIDAPVRENGRIHVAARADADTLIDARRSAVEAGTSALTGEAGPGPKEIRTDKTDVARLPDGRWRAFVLMSCNE